MHSVFPRGTRRVCCQHLYINCKNSGYSGTTFHKFFWTTVNAYNKYVFSKAMKEIQAYDSNVVEYLDSTTEQWSRHVLNPKVCCDHDTTNFVERYNPCTKPYRDLPVLTLLEGLCMFSSLVASLHFHS